MQLNEGIGILALGNLLRRDEGIGVHILEALRGRIPEHVEMIDGGTLGLELLSFLESKKRLIILDAVNAGVSSGEVIEWAKDDVPMYTTGKLSMHQMSFAEVLYWAHLTGGLPDEIVVIGVQPESLEWGTDPTEKAANAIPIAVQKVLNCLERWQGAPASITPTQEIQFQGARAQEALLQGTPLQESRLQGGTPYA